MSEGIDLNALLASIAEIRQTQLSEIDTNKQERETNALRRVTDDARFKVIDSNLKEANDRLDGHGKRQTISDTRWEAFFGDQGAFRLFIKKVDAHDAKLDIVLDGQNHVAGAIATAKWAIPLALTAAAMLGSVLVYAFSHGIKA